MKENMISKDKPPSSKTRLSKLNYEILRSFMEARICVKNRGVDGNNLIMEKISDADCMVTTPSWFNEAGLGYCIKSIAGKINITFKCVQEGILKIYLQSEYYKGRDEKKIPVWLDYDYFAVNGKAIVSETIATWHDKPFYFEQAVKDGESVTLDISWRPHAWNPTVMKDTVYNLQQVYYDRMLPPPDCTDLQLENTSNKMVPSFSILGICVSRDVVGAAGFKVNRFVQDVSPVSLVYGSMLGNGFRLDQNNIVDYLVKQDLNNFFRRNTILDFNKTMYEYFFEVKSDWLLLDAGILRHRTLIDNQHNAAVTEVHLNRLHCNYDINVCRMVSTMDLSEDDFTVCMESYITKLLNEYEEEKCIVLESYMAPVFVDNERCCIQKFKQDLNVRNASIRRGYRYMREHLNQAHFIPFIPDIPADFSHKWGLDPLHYVVEYYEYASQALKIIMKKLPRDEEVKAIDVLKDYYSKKIRYEYFV